MAAVLMHEASTISPNSESVKYSGSDEKSIIIAENNRTNGFSAQSISIQLDGIKYTVSKGFRKKEKKEILHGINGVFPPGQLVAIMGPSGAGKSTLLDILSGYRIKGVEGTVFVNGQPRNLKAFRKTSCYIQQDDRLQPLLTTAENMKIAADLKLPVHTKQAEKDQIIDKILVMLGLDQTKNTKAKGLSGGQKKRLSIALELINNPMVMFLDEPTTGLDSSSCSQCIKRLKDLALEGRTIICTIHQPSASLFEVFDQVYVLSAGRCLYQGAVNRLVPFLADINAPCPEYHNPADYIIELACEEFGIEIVERMVTATENGKSTSYLNSQVVPKFSNFEVPSNRKNENNDEDGLETTNSFNQLKVLLRRGYIKTRRDTTLTYMRVIVNICVGLMLGILYWDAGADGSKVLDNYNLLFSILMHHMMSSMMLTILTFPSELTILIKEHFNRWYSLKMYYTCVTLVDIPISIVSCFLFTLIIYYTSGQPMEMNRFLMFFIISMLVVFVAQSFGLMIGSVLNVVNGTFVGPTLSVPIMMFAGFGVSLRDLPPYLYWGSYISYLRYGLEGVVAAVYGHNRGIIECPEDMYCHYKYPKKLLEDVGVRADQFGNDVIALLITLFALRILAYVLLKYKLISIR